MNAPKVELRDLFAMAALIGLMAEPVPSEGDSSIVEISGDIDEFEGCAEDQLADAAYALADAMMSRRLGP